MMPSSEEETDSEEEEEFEDDYKQDFSGYAGKKDKFSIDDVSLIYIVCIYEVQGTFSYIWYFRTFNKSLILCGASM